MDELGKKIKEVAPQWERGGVTFKQLLELVQTEGSWDRVESSHS